MISKEKNIEMLKEYYRGDKDKLYTIVENNLYLICPLVKEISKRYNLSREYIYMTAMGELINAIDNYSLEKSVSFEDYVKIYVGANLQQQLSITSYKYRNQKTDSENLQKFKK